MLWLTQDIATLIDNVRLIAEKRVGKGEGLLIAPHWPGFYALLERKSPLWDIYFLYPETESRQNAIILRLRQENVNWAILGDVALDGRGDLRFRNTHRLVWEYLMDEFEAIRVDGLPSNYQLLRRKSPG